MKAYLSCALPYAECLEWSRLLGNMIGWVDLINEVINHVILFDSFLKVKSGKKCYHYFKDLVDHYGILYKKKNHLGLPA